MKLTNCPSTATTLIDFAGRINLQSDPVPQEEFNAAYARQSRNQGEESRCRSYSFTAIAMRASASNCRRGVRIGHPSGDLLTEIDLPIAPSGQQNDDLSPFCTINCLTSN